MAAILATAAIRWTLNDLKKLNQKPAIRPHRGFCTYFCHWAGYEHRQPDYFHHHCFQSDGSLACRRAAYFFTQTIKTLSGSKGIATLNQQELACVALTGCIGILAFSM